MILRGLDASPEAHPPTSVWGPLETKTYNLTAVWKSLYAFVSHYRYYLNQVSAFQKSIYFVILLQLRIWTA